MEDLKGRYDSLQEYMQAAVTPIPAKRDDRVAREWREDPTRAKWYGLKREEDQAKRGKFHGKRGMGLLNEVMGHGWKHGVDSIGKIREQLTIPKLPSVRRHARWSDQGDSVDMQQVYAGNLDRAWRRTKREQTGNVPRVTVATDSIASGADDPEDMMWRGAAAVALADALIAAGYVVECLSCFKATTMSGTVKADLQVKTKLYQSPWSLSDAAASMALPGFFRGFGHSWVANHARSYLRTPSMMVQGMQRDEVDAPLSQHVFLAPQSIRSLSSAKAWIASCLKELDGIIAEIEPIY
jgi:hypothetical protein